MTIYGLDLFSGIGGISYALREWVTPIAYCEIDNFCKGVLLSRMADRSIARAPVWDDICTFPYEQFAQQLDIVYGGFPCQDISLAGSGKGLEGKRSGLFFEVVRLCSFLKPRFIFLENVPAITGRGGMAVLRELTALGYDSRWCIISAASVGASHKRERWFLLAHSRDDGSPDDKRGRSIGKESSKGKQQKSPEVFKSTERASCISGNVSNSMCTRLEGQRQFTVRDKKEQPFPSCDSYPFDSAESWKKVVSEMGKCTDGISDHTHRLKSLGNGVVPKQVKEAFKTLMGIK